MGSFSIFHLAILFLVIGVPVAVLVVLLSRKR